MKYPPPAWEFWLITNEQVERAFRHMKWLKATKLGTVLNCVLSQCVDLLTPHIGSIYRVTFTTGKYPPDLSAMRSWYIIYNFSILRYLQKMEESFINNKAILVWRKTFAETHQKIKDIMKHQGGTLECARNHNCKYSMEKFQLINFTPKWGMPPKPNMTSRQHEPVMGKSVQISQYTILMQDYSGKNRVQWPSKREMTRSFNFND